MQRCIANERIPRESHTCVQLRLKRWVFASQPAVAHSILLFLFSWGGCRIFCATAGSVRRAEQMILGSPSRCLSYHDNTPVELGKVAQILAWNAPHPHSLDPASLCPLLAQDRQYQLVQHVLASPHQWEPCVLGVLLSSVEVCWSGTWIVRLLFQGSKLAG